MQEIMDFRCRPPFGNFLRDWIFRLEDMPGNPGLKTKFSRMGMELPPSLLKRSMQEFFRENEACGIVHSVVPLRVLPGLDNDDLAALLKARKQLNKILLNATCEKLIGNCFKI